MNIYEAKTMGERINGNSYVGRGIVAGLSENGRYAVAAYFIMGRSTNSRNRVFVEDGEGIRTQAFDEALLSDPSLIIYSPVRVLGDTTIVTNGDQTDTIYDGLKAGKGFKESLETREFEPDPPNYTPRISGVMNIAFGRYDYALSILKANSDASGCDRYTYVYAEPVKGEGRLIHTYMTDGDPLPSFEGEPVCVSITDDLETMTSKLWDALDSENKVSLFVRFIDIATGVYTTKIINKHK